MQPPAPSHAAPGRRRALAVFVNSTIALIGGGLTALLGAVVRPPATAGNGRWVRAGSTATLVPGVPVPRVLAVLRVDGWYRERARETVFLVWDGGAGVHALSATCTHLGCQVRWEAADRQFHCPCHGGVYGADGAVLSGPPPRPLEAIAARVDPADGSVLVRV